MREQLAPDLSSVCMCVCECVHLRGGGQGFEIADILSSQS